MLAENLLATLLGLEVASGNDAISSHSDMRKTAKLMMQFIPGTDFICSGYSAVPREDNLFGGGNFDASEFDDWNVLQRDMQIDGGIHPITEENALAIRRKAARAVQAVYRELGFPQITDEEVEAAVIAHGSQDMPERNPVPDMAAADQFLASDATLLTVAHALQRTGFDEVAYNILEMGRQRLTGDYLQPAAIFDRDFRVLSGINDLNDYTGPGTGYRLENERWEQIQRLPQEQSPLEFIQPHLGEPLQNLIELGPAQKGSQREVVIGVGPAFGTALTRTIGGFSHEEVLAVLLTGIAREGLVARVVKVYHSSDCAALGYVASHLSGSGIGIGIQSRGTTVIHQRGLAMLNNLELFSQSPSLTLQNYEAIGRNAACYAKGLSPAPVAVKIDSGARLRLIVKTTLLHRRETEEVRLDQPPIELHFDWEPE